MFMLFSSKSYLVLLSYILIDALSLAFVNATFLLSKRLTNDESFSSRVDVK